MKRRRPVGRRRWLIGRNLEALEDRSLLAHLWGHLERWDASCNRVGVMPVDPSWLEEIVDTMAADPGPSSPLQVPIFHSNPGAEKVIFLDFDGHIVEDTRWNENNDDLPIHAPAFDLDSDIFSFSGTELARIEEVWRRVAEDFSPFGVDVTTEDPGDEILSAGGDGKRVLISTNIDDPRLGGTGNRWYDTAGGVAYVGSWNWRSDTPVWVFENALQGSAKKIAEASSHEMGHALGLSHDGTLDGSEYYTGHGSGETGWAPIMGVSYDRNVTQWSRGEYANANNRENDLVILAGRLGYRADDHGRTASTATLLAPLANNDLRASGVIGPADDVDVFRIDVGPSAGHITLNVAPLLPGPNLDVLIQVYDHIGNLVASDNPVDLLEASFDKIVHPGRYFVHVQGAGNGDPLSGYSTYGSIGQYAINGTLNYEGDLLLGDIDGDGTVDASDAGIMFSEWGRVPSILPGSAEPGTAIASYHPVTGEVIVSINNVNDWRIEAEGGFTGSLPANLPQNGGLVLDTDDAIGEFSFVAHSFTNLNLGYVAQTGLRNLTLTYTPALGVPRMEGTILAGHRPGPAPSGSVIASFFASTGDIIVSVNNVVHWCIESPSLGLVGPRSGALPAADGTLHDSQQKLGETAALPMSYQDLDLGTVALPRLHDLRLMYQVEHGGPMLFGAIQGFGRADLDADGYVDAHDADLLFSSWTISPLS